jgi:ketosteroid isomerase-like protein
MPELSKTDILSELADRQAIHDATLRYSRGVDRLDAEMLRSAYHDDAIDDHGVMKTPRDEFVAAIIPLLRDGYSSTSHILHNQFIELEGDVAYCETYFTAVQVHSVGGQDIQETVNGRYVDRFERREVGWRIALRRVIMDSSTSCPVQSWQGTSNIALMERGKRDGTDAIYQMRALSAPR